MVVAMNTLTNDNQLYQGICGEKWEKAEFFWTLSCNNYFIQI